MKSRLLVILYTLLLLPYTVLGQGNTDGGPAVNSGPGITNPIVGVDNLADLVRIILEAAVKIGLPLVAVAFVYAGFLFVTAGGNTEKLDTAKRAMLYTFIGAALVIGSWALAQLISDTVLQIE